MRRVDTAGKRHASRIGWIDHSAKRDFANDAGFDDTFPAGEGVLEAGYRVPLGRLPTAMEDWFRRKGYVKVGERLKVAQTGGGGRQP